MADLIIRNALKKDFPAIRRLIREVRINPTGLDWRHFLVAVDSQDGLLGCGQIKTHSDGSLELASIAVQARAHGQGVARAVIQELIRHETARPLYLMCRSQLQGLYAKFGFQAIDLDDMPVYFKRIKRAEGIFNANARPEDRLAVMRLR